MANIGIGFQLSASAVGMSQGINAGVVELQKLGYTAKQTARDVATLRTIEISRAFINSVTTIARTFQAFTSGALNAIDNTRQLAASLGVTYGELRTLQVAADLSGASSEQLAAAFTKAQLTISKAAGGSKDAAAALDKLGLSAAELSKLSSTDQFAAIAEAINQIENPAQRAAAAVEIFGRSGAQLLPTFRELPENLGVADQFLRGFRDGVNGIDPTKIDAIGDSFGLAGQAMQELAGRILTELQPALTQGTDNFIKFIQSIDVPAAARTLSAALSDVANVLAALARTAVPLANNLLPAIGGYLAFINRQVLASGIAGLARFFSAAAASALGYAGAAGTAATATAALGVSIRTTLASTGIGALVVGLGLLAGAAIDWALASKQAGADFVVAVQQPDAEVKKLQATIQAATADSVRFGERVKEALRVPDINRADFAQDSLGQAESAFKRLAEQLGGLARVPQEIVAEFAVLIDDAERANREVVNQQFALQQVDQAARNLAQRLLSLADARNRDSEAAKRATEEAKKLAEENRKRVAELASQGLTSSEQSRIQLNRDLLAITQEQRAAEEALAAARRAGDLNAIEAARQRLQLSKDATKEARKQDRQRQLEALGIDQNLLKPASSLADQFKAVRTAFDRKLIDGGEARDALRNLAAEGVQIRAEIIAELSRPVERALQISDVRTSDGISQFFNAGRTDPAIEQRREQLKKLEEIRRGLENIGIRPVDILS